MMLFHSGSHGQFKSLTCLMENMHSDRWALRASSCCQVNLNDRNVVNNRPAGKGLTRPSSEKLSKLSVPARALRGFRRAEKVFIALNQQDCKNTIF